MRGRDTEKERERKIIERKREKERKRNIKRMK